MPSAHALRLSMKNRAGGEMPQRGAGLGNSETSSLPAPGSPSPHLLLRNLTLLASLPVLSLPTTFKSSANHLARQLYALKSQVRSAPGDPSLEQRGGTCGSVSGWVARRGLLQRGPCLRGQEARAGL